MINNNVTYPQTKLGFEISLTFSETRICLFPKMVL